MTTAAPGWGRSPSSCRPLRPWRSVDGWVRRGRG
jgi:hypothetical protein